MAQDECKARHAELLARLCEIFVDPDWEQELWEDLEEGGEDDSAGSVY